MIITIDGPAGTGKSSVTKKVAARLHMLVLDTGALYRALGYRMLQKGIDIKDEKQVSAFLTKNALEIVCVEGSFHYFFGDADTTMYLRTQEVAHAASLISTYESVRTYLLPIQRNFATKGNIVCEGRDAGTTIFPQADVKIFLTASVKERAQRRLLEYIQAGITTCTIETLEQEITERDNRDTARKISPLKVPEDAFILDTTTLTLDQVVDEIVFLVKEKETPKRNAHWLHFPHQSDVGIRGFGTTPAEAFEQAALALTAIIADLQSIEPKKLVTLSLQGESEETLFIDWLNALLYEMSTKNMLFSRFRITLLPGFLRASLWGEEINTTKHQPAVEVKGATYHLLSVKQQEDGLWTAECVVDV